MNDFTADLAHYESLQPVTDKLPTTRAELATYGITGIESPHSAQPTQKA